MDIIIGAGISGLTYANFTNNNYIIFEADSEIGGYCKTIKQDGFTWDYSGHFFHFQHQWIEDYITKNIAVDSILKCKKETQIKYNDRYIDFPFQKNIHQLEQQEFIDCLYDLFEEKEEEISNFKNMLYVKFGKSIANKFLIPYNEKLYACDLNTLDVGAMGRFFPHANKEEIISNFKKTDTNSYNSYFTYPRGGAIEYVKSLAHKLDQDKLFLNERVKSIDTKNKVVTINSRELKYDNIISSIPFPALLSLCKIEYDKEVYTWNKVLVFNLGFDKKGNDKKNNWVYFPEKEYCFYRIGYYDNIFNDDRMSLYVELAFKKDDIIDVEFCKKQVLIDLEKAGVVSGQKLISSHSVIMNPAYVHIKQESIADVNLKKDLLASYGVYSIGRYGSWTYSSIEDNMIEAINLSKKINSKDQC